ncbi:carbohydrate-binding module family 50 protein [Hyaloscypha bicolor E]|uniref:Carbohydrate-binding module family 50 protein n=1 Tax=Hyaloscypha bicolor E TaxID=1095630 RepID=A0A2J6TE04_9HELO|nr:carbohydrate-binding module family 50 protein [Hyaloscypha bicolor E]PMD61264.1 carbohydrate-binding module family 50 protein [Hyaloscypha bicolor E]
MAWNPAVKSDCSNLVAGDAYCVNGDTSPSSSSPSTRSAVPTRASASASLPLRFNHRTTKSCLKWYVVQSGNICYYIDNANGISFTQFRAWNTGVDAGCSNIIPGVAYFVSSAAVTKAKTGEIEVEPVWKEMLPPKFPGVDRAFDEIVTEEE